MEERDEILQVIIKNILATTDEQIQGNLKNSLRLRMSLSECLTEEVKFLRILKYLVEKKVEEIFNEKNYPASYEEFVNLWTRLSQEAKVLSREINYEVEEKICKYEFIYFEVYCNVYLRYSLGLLFNGNNKSTLKELEKYDSKKIITNYRYFLRKISLRKIEKSLMVLN